MFSSGDGGVGDGDPDPATQQCFTNDGRNTTKFLAGFPASCPLSVLHPLFKNTNIPNSFENPSSVTAVGGTIHVPEVAVSFSGGGFSNTVIVYLSLCVLTFDEHIYEVLSPFLSRRCCRGLPKEQTSEG